MSRAEFLATIATCGWTPRNVVVRLGYSAATAQRWGNTYPVPMIVAKWLRQAAADALANPVPTRAEIEAETAG